MRTKILMVCLGNICRSPMAEGILRSKIDPSSVYVDSAGTADYHLGKPPDARAVHIARSHGIDITKQRCRQLQSSDFHDFDYIYAMDQANLADILSLTIDEASLKKVRLLLEPNEGWNGEVLDPYNGDLRAFEEVFQCIDSACDRIAERLRS